MKRNYFGTDGVRGAFGGDLINPEFARRLGRAAGCFLRDRDGVRRAVLGRDTRYSGPVLEAALVAGLTESGIDVVRLGVVPTPAVAAATLHHAAGLGVVITASHNPADDNGIKFFAPSGRKLSDEAEAAIERGIDDLGRPVGRVGCGVVNDECGLSFYEDVLSKILPRNALRGWSIVLDTANGAAYRTAPEVWARLGCRLVHMGAAPDGRNINDGVGSQYPDEMARSVVSHGANLGIALDGDGDRVVLADENGSVLSGDEVLGILGLNALRRGALAGETVVVTVQSNLGLDEAIRQAGGRVERTAIGDRNVIARLASGGFSFGGESSGHILFPELSPAGDGTLAGLKAVEVMLQTGLPLSKLRQAIRRYPQLVASLDVERKPAIDALRHLPETVRAAEDALGADGRVLVRYSGTEPKLRLLVEGPDEKEIGTWMDRLREAARRDGLLGMR